MYLLLIILIIIYYNNIITNNQKRIKLTCNTLFVSVKIWHRQVIV